MAWPDSVPPVVIDASCEPRGEPPGGRGCEHWAQDVYGGVWRRYFYPPGAAAAAPAEHVQRPRGEAWRHKPASRPRTEVVLRTHVAPADEAAATVDSFLRGDCWAALVRDSATHEIRRTLFDSRAAGTDRALNDASDAARAAARLGAAQLVATLGESDELFIMMGCEDFIDLAVRPIGGMASAASAARYSVAQVEYW
jgi:hypothetical protein